jgi:hypothetical protein
MRIHMIADIDDVFVAESGNAQGKGFLALMADDDVGIFGAAAAYLSDVDEIDQVATDADRERGDFTDRIGTFWSLDGYALFAPGQRTGRLDRIGVASAWTKT